MRKPEQIARFSAQFREILKKRLTEPKKNSNFPHFPSVSLQCGTAGTNGRRVGCRNTQPEEFP